MTYGHYDTYIGEEKVMTSDMDEILSKNMGITLAQTNMVNLKYDFLPEYGAYYYRNNGTNYDSYKMLYGYRENGSVYLFYDKKLPLVILIYRIILFMTIYTE